MLKSEANEQERGTFVLHVIVTHNFFVEKLVSLVEPEAHVECEQFCCVTCFKFDKENDDDVSVALIHSSSDEHVITKSPL